jgi:hypothetical protein
MATTPVFRQLYLFDCDGGRSALFHDITNLRELPNNCELYLFWNNNDRSISNNLNQLKDNQQLHLCPSHLVNSKNSADGKLIYFLGKLVNEFSVITIVQGADEIFQEVVEAVKYDFTMNKIVLHKVKAASSSELKTLIQSMRKLNNEKQYIEDDYELIGGSLRLKPSFVKFQLSNACRVCNKSFKNTVSAMSHLISKHDLLNSDIMYIAVRHDASFLVTPAKKNNNNTSAIIISNGKEPLRCSNSACSSKKRTFKKKKDLEQHQMSKHKSSF